jgi:hypothetical protein
MLKAGGEAAMLSMSPDDWSRLGEAIVLWSGWGRASFPLHKEQPVVDRFGEQQAAELMPQLRFMVDEFYASDARCVAADLKEMAALSMEQFVKRYPSLPADAVRALAWCYTFDNK